MKRIEKRAFLFYSPKENVVNDVDSVLKLLEEKGWEVKVFKPDEKAWKIDKKADIAIVLGGDGSILYVSRHVDDIPILGVNYGKIGYLTEIVPGELSRALDMVSDERYWLEEVNRLEGFISDEYGEKKVELPSVLNEYLIFTSRLSKMLSYEIYLNGEPLTKGRGDGLIVSTSIGTTAYALSAGGPVFAGNVKAFLMVPLAPLWGKLRPLVIPDYLTLTIKLLRDGWSGVVVADGIDQYEIPRGSSITIWLSEKKTRFIRFGSRYERLTRLMLIL